VCAAIETPERIRTLTAIGSPMTALSPAVRRKTRFALLLLSLGARDLVGRLVGAAMLSPANHREHLAYVRRCFREAPSGGFRCAVRSISLARKDLTPELPRVAVPTLLIAGGDDGMWPPDAARRDATAIAGARCETVPGAAHLAPLERPRETLAAITDFLVARTDAAGRAPHAPAP
jgi:pimeloyl-ACP methyl ester carboxylesterase